jgi:hypothetical protein
MELEDTLPFDPTPGEAGLGTAFYVVLAVPTLLGMAHHVDHIVRGNHVGWPLTAHVNPFTYSLAIYPLIALGLYLTATDRAGAGYWTGLFTFSALLLGFLHLSPWAVEPPGDVILPYASPVVGSLAFAVLLALIVSVAGGAVYAAVLWRRGAR